MQRTKYLTVMESKRAILFAAYYVGIMSFFLLAVILFSYKAQLIAQEPGKPVLTTSRPYPDGRPLQKVLEDVDRRFKRPDGLYRGTLTLLRRNEPTVVQQFELIVRSPQAYLTLRSARRGEELRILWIGEGLAVWVYDVPRRQLIRPEAAQRFEPLSAMGFAPVDFFYPWFAENLKPRSWRYDTLRSDQRIIDCTLFETDRPQLSIGVDSSDVPVRLEVKDQQGVILRVLEFGQGRPLLEWRTNRQYDAEFPSLYEMMDLRRASVARFETRIYDPLFRPDPSLFDPDFLSR